MKKGSAADRTDTIVAKGNRNKWSKDHTKLKWTCTEEEQKTSENEQRTL